MRLLIRYVDGSIRIAMFLAVIGSRIRVALPGSDDAVEYPWAGGAWCDESCAPVEIEFEPSEGAFDRSRWCSDLPLADTAFAPDCYPAAVAFPGSGAPAAGGAGALGPN
jgi:hypothetical protein